MKKRHPQRIELGPTFLGIGGGFFRRRSSFFFLLASFIFFFLILVDWRALSTTSDVWRPHIGARLRWDRETVVNLGTVLPSVIRVKELQSILCK